MTEDATWESSNPSVASVNRSGLVTGVGRGEAVISATYQNVIGRMSMNVPPVTYRLSGKVTDELSGAALSTVYVWVTDSASELHEGGTSADGTYSFTGVHAGSISIGAEKNGYITAKQDVTLDSDRQIDLVLARSGNAAQ